MANPQHLELLRQGVDAWNEWRKKEPSICPDLLGANLSEANLFGANLSGANLNAVGLFRANLGEADLCRAGLSGANLGDADLSRANLSGANLTLAYLRRANLHRANLAGAGLTRADFWGANVRGANLSGTNLQEANLHRANLAGADLTRADLSNANIEAADLRGANLHEATLHGANLRAANLCGANLGWAILNGAVLIETNLADAILTGCSVYGIGAWSVKLSEKTEQNDLIITPPGEPVVTVDDLEVAQFIYLMLHNEKLQRVIDTITSKVVLILGRFSPERKMVLDALRDKLRTRNYVPVVFDFEKPRSGTTINTITLLARMARFVIADISDAKSVLMELQAIVPQSPKLPVQPIIVSTQEEPGMFNSFEAYPWFLKVHRYDDQAQLLAHLDDRVIGPVEVAKRR